LRGELLHGGDRFRRLRFVVDDGELHRMPRVALIEDIGRDLDAFELRIAGARHAAGQGQFHADR
jgi:hypothetical protein